jgi:hypothetical protein
VVYGLSNQSYLFFSSPMSSPNDWDELVANERDQPRKKFQGWCFANVEMNGFPTGPKSTGFSKLGISQNPLDPNPVQNVPPSQGKMIL